MLLFRWLWERFRYCNLLREVVSKFGMEFLILYEERLRCKILVIEVMFSSGFFLKEFLFKFKYCREFDLKKFYGILLFKWFEESFSFCSVWSVVIFCGILLFKLLFWRFNFCNLVEKFIGKGFVKLLFVSFIIFKFVDVRSFLGMLLFNKLLL